MRRTYEFILAALLSLTAHVWVFIPSSLSPPYGAPGTISREDAKTLALSIAYMKAAARTGTDTGSGDKTQGEDSATRVGKDNKGDAKGNPSDTPGGPSPKSGKDATRPGLTSEKPGSTPKPAEEKAGETLASRPGRTSTSSAPQIEKVVDGGSRAAHSEERGGDWAVAKETSEVPPLALVWESPSHLVKAARALGFKVLGVDASSRIVGELLLAGTSPRLDRYSSSAGNAKLSNRLRTLPGSYFANVDRALGVEGRISEWWILPTADADREFVRIQTEVLRARGLVDKPGAVRSMKAKLVEDHGTFKLAILEVIEEARDDHSGGPNNG